MLSPAVDVAEDLIKLGVAFIVKLEFILISSD